MQYQRCSRRARILTALVRHSHARGQRGCTHANFTCSMASFSPRTHCSQRGSPYDIIPRMILDTFNPDFPRRTAIPGVRKIHSKCFKVQSHTVGNSFGDSRGSHNGGLVRRGSMRFWRQHRTTTSFYTFMIAGHLLIIRWSNGR